MIPRLKPGENEKIEKIRSILLFLMILAVSFSEGGKHDHKYEDSLENNAMAGSPPHLRVSSGAGHPTCQNKPHG